MNSAKKLTCFKAYDVRGKLGEEIDEDIAYRIGRAIALSQMAKTMVMGFDARATSPGLADMVAKGICDLAPTSWTPNSQRQKMCRQHGWCCADVEITASQILLTTMAQNWARL